MSTLKTGNITHPSSTGTAITLDASDNVTINGPTNFNSNALSGIASINGGQIGGNRNLIINGAMQVAQRGAGPFTNASGGYQTVDRFQLSGTLGGSFTLEQASDAPSGSGFNKSFKALAPTGFSSPPSAASAKIITSIEGQNLQQLLKGSSNALPVTLSFWVKSVVTGTYIFELYDDDNNRTISTAYSVSASNTWEKKVITISGDTSGALDNDANSSLSLVWWIGAGSNFTSGTLNTSWNSTVTANRAAGQVNAVASNNDAFYITGVQLEVGSQATAFQHRLFGDELARCQRYYYALTNDGTTTNYMVGGVETSTAAGLGGLAFPTSMRAVPTATLLGTNVTKFYSGATGTDDSVSIGANRCSSTIGSLYITGFTGGTVGQACSLYNGGSGSGISFDAEL